jgi:hypothetical protein
MFFSRRINTLIHLKIINPNLYIMKKKILFFVAAIVLSMASAFAQYTITVSATPAAGGVVIGGGTEIPYGASMTVCAIPNPCYNFVRWEEVGVIVSYDPCYTFVVTQSRHLVAVFAPIPAESVIINAPTIVCDGSYAIVEVVTIPYSLHPWVTYEWYLNGVVIPFSNYTTFYPQLEPSPYPYCYSVVVTSIEFGCMVMSPTHCINVVVPLITGITADKTEIFQGETVQLVAEVPALYPDIIYQWYGNGIAIPNANTTILYASPTATTIYTLTAFSSDLECSAVSNEIMVTVNNEPSVGIVGPDFVCGESTVTLQAVTNFELTHATYRWYMDGVLIAIGDVNVLTKNLLPRIEPYCFWVEVIDMEYGTLISPIHCIYVEESPPIGILSDKTEILEGESVELKANVTDLFKRIYKWFANGAPIPGDSAVIHVNPTTTTVYKFTATSENNEECVSESNEITIIVSENGSITSILDIDGNTDIIFYPNPSNGQFTITSKKIIESIELYDVAGKKVLSSTPKAQTTQISVELSHGVYTYRAVLQDNSICTGKIIIQ